MKRLQVRILSTIHFGLSCSKAGRKTFAMFLEGFDSLTVHIRFVGVTANISDCLSDSMSSILIRTALPDSVMVNISHFDCDVLSSSLSPVTNEK